MILAFTIADFQISWRLAAFAEFSSLLIISRRRSLTPLIASSPRLPPRAAC